MDPTYNIEGLQPYIKQNRDELITRFMLKGRTLDRIAIRSNIKTQEAIHYADIDVTFRNGKGCGFSPDGKPLNLSDRILKTALLEVDKEFCADDLLGSYAEDRVKIGASEAELPFEVYISELIVNKIAEKLEKLIWQGDTSKTTDTDLKWIDGFLMQAIEEDDTIEVEVPAGSSDYELIKAVYMAMPEEVLKQATASIHVQPSIFRGFMQDLVEKNLFHYNGAQEQELDEFYFPGSGVKVVKTEGLAGTGVVYASFDRNLVYGCDKEGDKRDLKIGYDEKQGNFWVKVRFNAGVTTYFPDWVVIGGKGGNTPVVPVESVAFDQAAIQLPERESLSVAQTLTILPEDATDKTVTWASNNEAVATVNSDGLATAVAVGVAVITAEVGGKVATLAVTVTAAESEA